MSSLVLDIDGLEPVPEDIENILLGYTLQKDAHQELLETPDEKNGGLLCLVREHLNNKDESDDEYNETSSSKSSIQYHTYTDNYEEYTILEKHLEFSESIFNINTFGHYILSEIKDSKMEYGLFKDNLVETTFSTITNIIKAKISGTCTLMNELMCFLDEMLFVEVENVSSFYIDDAEFAITQVYYGQAEWLDARDQQKFKFTKDKPIFIEGEIMILMCFVNDYLSILDKIQEHIDTRHVKYSTHVKALKLITRIYEKIERLKDKLVDIINHSIGN
jgi:hypothetical protein